MWLGVLFALIAGLFWGLGFVTPLLLPDYSAPMQAVGRYLAFGLIALPVAWLDRARLAQLSRADWVEAVKLALAGNLLYYLFLASAIAHAGSPLPTVMIGTLPVVIAVVANLRNGQRDGRLPWSRMALPLVLMLAGIACVNQSELAALPQIQQGSVETHSRYAWGALLALGALACWTWYPIRNADWLRNNPSRSPRTWATAQGIATLPLALCVYVVIVGWSIWNMPAAPDTSSPVAVDIARVAGADRVDATGVLVDASSTQGVHGASAVVRSAGAADGAGNVARNVAAAPAVEPVGSAQLAAFTELAQATHSVQLTDLAQSAPTIQTAQVAQAARNWRTLLLGQRPAVFVSIMLAVGLLSSWLGTLCWNEASQRLPTQIAGQLIVFETLAALTYAFVLRAHLPPALVLLGIGLLVAGVVLGVRVKPVPPTASGGQAQA